MSIGGTFGCVNGGCVSNTALPEPLIIGSDTNNVTIDRVNAVRLSGDTTVWDDLRVPLATVRASGTKPPSFDVFKGNTRAWAFSDEIEANEEKIFFQCQMPHNWKLGSNIYPHIHWSPAENPAGPDNDVVRWELEYTWASINEAFPGTSTIYVNAEMGAADALKHLLHHFTDGVNNYISGAGKGLSSILNCRLTRASGNVADTYDGKDAFGIEIDFHYEIDSMGSNEEISKN